MSRESQITDESGFEGGHCLKDEGDKNHRPFSTDKMNMDKLIHIFFTLSSLAL